MFDGKSHFVDVMNNPQPFVDCLITSNLLSFVSVFWLLFLATRRTLHGCYLSPQVKLKISRSVREHVMKLIGVAVPLTVRISGPICFLCRQETLKGMLVN